MSGDDSRSSESWAGSNKHFSPAVARAAPIHNSRISESGTRANCPSQHTGLTPITPSKHDRTPGPGSIPRKTPWANYSGRYFSLTPITSSDYSGTLDSLPNAAANTQNYGSTPTTTSNLTDSGPGTRAQASGSIPCAMGAPGLLPVTLGDTGDASESTFPAMVSSVTVNQHLGPVPLTSGDSGKSPESIPEAMAKSLSEYSGRDPEPVTSSHIGCAFDSIPEAMTSNMSQHLVGLGPFTPSHDSGTCKSIPNTTSTNQRQRKGDSDGSAVSHGNGGSPEPGAATSSYQQPNQPHVQAMAAPVPSETQTGSVDSGIPRPPAPPTPNHKPVSRQALWKRKQTVLREQMAFKRWHIKSGGHVVLAQVADNGKENGRMLASELSLLQGGKTAAAIIADAGKEEEMQTIGNNLSEAGSGNQCHDPAAGHSTDVLGEEVNSRAQLEISVDFRSPDGISLHVLGSTEENMQFNEQERAGGSRGECTSMIKEAVEHWPRGIGVRRYPELKAAILDAAIVDIEKILRSKHYSPDGQNLTRYLQIQQFLDVQKKNLDKPEGNRRLELALHVAQGYRGGRKLASRILQQEKEWVRRRYVTPGL